MEYETYFALNNLDCEYKGKKGKFFTCQLCKEFHGAGCPSKGTYWGCCSKIGDKKYLDALVALLSGKTMCPFFDPLLSPEDAVDCVGIILQGQQVDLNSLTYL